MLKIARTALAAITLSLAAASLGNAATPSTVKVALLDMTALWGPAYGAGYGMTGPGFNSDGGPGPGYGMMGQGYGPGGGNGPGNGMMGQGYGSGGNGSGYGMMGSGLGRGGYGPGWGMGGMMGGMMGMMSVRTNVASVSAGMVTLDVSNLSRSLVHELIVIAVDNPNAPLPFDYGTGQVPEKQVKVMGETDELQPNAEKSVAIDLKPGSYLLICNVPGHYALGMWTPLTVTQ